MIFRAIDMHSSAYIPAYQRQAMRDNQLSLVGESNPLAGLLCLFGFFLHIVLSDPLLNSIGFHYSGDEGKFYEKIHPGTVFIFLSFVVLLWDRGHLVRRSFQLWREQKIFVTLLLLYGLIFLYMILRSGGAGIAFMIDTHMTAAICAIVLSYTPLSYCRRAVHFFITVAAINSLIGIAEGIGRFRIFTFDPNWVVMKETYFRASALRGHPLNNTMFTAVALFVALSLRYPPIIKVGLIIVLVTSLIAFGGRVGLAIAVPALMVMGLLEVKRRFAERNLSMLQLFMIVAVMVVVPVLFVGMLYLLINSSMGERIATHSQWDESADSRRLALMVFDYMSLENIVFGVSTDRILDIAYRMNLSVPLSDIENPWLLMFMYFGLVMFPFWLAAIATFIYKLMKDQPLALKMAVLAYFIIASTSNSFGRKDSTFLIMVSAVICAARTLQAPVAPKMVVLTPSYRRRTTQTGMA